MAKEFHVTIEDCKYVPEHKSFAMVVRDFESKKLLDRPLQVSRTAMLKVAGVDPENPVIDDDLMHFYARQLRDRSKDHPITLQDSDVDEMSPYIEKELKRSNRNDEDYYGQSMEDFRQENHPKGLFLPTNFDRK